VEREHTVIRIATDHLLRSIQEGTLGLEENLKRLDIYRASNMLESTYIIRLFTEFETGLKRFLKAKRLKIPRNAKPLINRVAARIGIAGDALTNTHKVREYRNKIVHSLEKEDDEALLTIRRVTSFLCTFFDRLRVAW
jgi:hypothetical protein